ncbi:hypothetical protein BOW52_10905 [Solemya elarraichensis gill symbiont]|uniref:Uncharacterized protein n=1 Tax=Solemya elarraichensis gill symbiont TaxID=1918949 RepID=A0A1T2KTN3_9GAMM|nr:hypothetical protein BOW52_10905 [Solemya elarraichensis gill symbiont]
MHQTEAETGEILGFRSLTVIFTISICIDGVSLGALAQLVIKTNCPVFAFARGSIVPVTIVFAIGNLDSIVAEVIGGANLPNLGLRCAPRRENRRRVVPGSH